MSRMNVLVSILLGVALSGCAEEGPELHEVTGRVTLDGEPLPNATLQFTPSDGSGRPSWGRTNENGEYELGYAGDTMGALPGEHRVRISTFQDIIEDPETSEVIPGSPERLPEVYTSGSELRANIPSEGPIDFDLKSDAGEIIQPDYVGELDETAEESGY